MTLFYEQCSAPKLSRTIIELIQLNSMDPAKSSMCTTSKSFCTRVYSVSVFQAKGIDVTFILWLCRKLHWSQPGHNRCLPRITSFSLLSSSLRHGTADKLKSVHVKDRATDYEKVHEYQFCSIYSGIMPLEFIPSWLFLTNN